jgi:hypothetical protein
VRLDLQIIASVKLTILKAQRRERKINSRVRRSHWRCLCLQLAAADSWAISMASLATNVRGARIA